MNNLTDVAKIVCLRKAILIPNPACDTLASVVTAHVCRRHLESCHPQQYLIVQQKSLRAKSSAGDTAPKHASGKSPIEQALQKGAMLDSVRAQHNRRFMLWCIHDMRPFSVNMGLGFDLFVGGLSPLYAAQKMHHETLVNMMTAEYFKVKDIVKAALRDQWTSLGSAGPFCSIQMDMTTTNNVSFCAMSVSFIAQCNSGKLELVKINLVTRAFPFEHTAAVGCRGLGSHLPHCHPDPQSLPHRRLCR